MKKLILGSIAILIALFAILLGTADSHHTNVGYISWKMGWSDYDPDMALIYLNVDVAFRTEMHGKSFKETTEFFPDLRSLDKSNEYQSYYKGSIAYEEFYWIGDSAWGIEFRHGELHEFHLFKG